MNSIQSADEQCMAAASAQYDCEYVVRSEYVNGRDYYCSWNYDTGECHAFYPGDTVTQQYVQNLPEDCADDDTYCW